MCIGFSCPSNHDFPFKFCYRSVDPDCFVPLVTELCLYLQLVRTQNIINAIPRIGAHSQRLI